MTQSGNAITVVTETGTFSLNYSLLFSFKQCHSDRLNDEYFCIQAQLEKLQQHKTAQKEKPDKVFLFSTIRNTQIKTCFCSFAKQCKCQVSICNNCLIAIRS